MQYTIVDNCAALAGPTVKMCCVSQNVTTVLEETAACTIMIKINIIYSFVQLLTTKIPVHTHISLVLYRRGKMHLKVVKISL